MAPARPLQKRSALEWGTRGLLAIIVAVIGYVAVSQSLANATPRNSVARAHALAPSDGRIMAVLAQTLFWSGAGTADRLQSISVAKAALIQDPTAIPAVVTLALNDQLRGNMAAAHRLFSYSEMLSRRNLETQLWKAEEAVAHNDISNALKHYDIALRTSEAAQGLMYPILASAIDDPSIRSTLVHTLAAKPNWTASFVEYASWNGADPRATAIFFRALGKAGVGLSDAVRTSLINTLFTHDMFNEAWDYYTSIHPKVDRSTSRDPNFMSGTSNPSPFDWIAQTDYGMATSIQRGTKSGIFDFAAPSGIGGILLQQAQMLPPGAYELKGRSVAIDQPAASRPYWTISCKGGDEFGRLNMPNSEVEHGAFSGRFTVPSGCPVQTLALVARASDMASGISGQIQTVVIRPLH